MATTSTAPVEVRQVSTPAAFRAFFRFPWVLYRENPHWVPMLLSMRRELLDQQNNPSWQYMEGDYFAAWRGDQIVGTIAAYINHRHNDFQDERIGWFGAFEVYDDAEAARALLDTAAAWVREKGYPAMRGPQTFTTHEECGLLIDGFERPVLLMPYNPPYYQRLIENAGGFHKVMDTHSYHLTKEHAQEVFADGRMKRLAEAAMKRHNITVRQIDPRNLKGDFQLFKDLYNAGWVKNWGFVPMTPAELDALVESLGMFFDPKLAFFGEINGDPAGFVMAVPDFNQVLKAANPRPGVPEIYTLLRALWFWKVRRVIDWVRVPLIGIKPEYRQTGVDAAMYYHLIEAIMASDWIRHSDGGWALETNDLIISIAKRFGYEQYRTYRYYEKDVSL